MILAFFKKIFFLSNFFLMGLIVLLSKVFKFSFLPNWNETSAK
jgi:hypothetical protein